MVLQQVVFLFLMGVSGFICTLLSYQLMSMVSQKYPDVYEEYNKGSAFISPLGSFLAEFVLGGMYKHELREEDFKYVRRVKVSFGVIILVLVGNITFDILT